MDIFIDEGMSSNNLLKPTTIFLALVGISLVAVYLNGHKADKSHQRPQSNPKAQIELVEPPEVSSKGKSNLIGTSDTQGSQRKNQPHPNKSDPELANIETISTTELASALKEHKLLLLDLSALQSEHPEIEFSGNEHVAWYANQLKSSFTHQRLLSLAADIGIENVLTWRHRGLLGELNDLQNQRIESSAISPLTEASVELRAQSTVNQRILKQQLDSNRIELAKNIARAIVRKRAPGQKF